MISVLRRRCLQVALAGLALLTAACGLETDRAPVDPSEDDGRELHVQCAGAEGARYPRCAAAGGER